MNRLKSSHHSPFPNAVFACCCVSCSLTHSMVTRLPNLQRSKKKTHRSKRVMIRIETNGMQISVRLVALCPIVLSLTIDAQSETAHKQDAHAKQPLISEHVGCVAPRYSLSPPSPRVGQRRRRTSCATHTATHCLVCALEWAGSSSSAASRYVIRPPEDGNSRQQQRGGANVSG